MILGCFGFFVGLFLFEFFASLGAWGRLVGLAVTLPYFGILDSSVGGGQTLGKRIMKIEVIDGTGAHIPLARSIFRYLFLGIPILLNGAPIQFGTATILLGALIGFLVFGMGGSDLYLFAFNRRTRQSLHDLATGTFVVTRDGSGQAVTRPFWRPHLAILGSWCLVILSFGAFVPLTARHGPFPKLLSLQERLMASGMVLSSSVFVGTNYSYVNGVKTETAYLQANAIWKNRPRDYREAANEVASIALKNYPDIGREGVLVVTITYGYDIGISRAWISKSYQHSPREWTSLLPKPI
jgi:uncharacterized RDD family membrane protein YckC